MSDKEADFFDFLFNKGQPLKPKNEEDVFKPEPVWQYHEFKTVEGNVEAPKKWKTKSRNDRFPQDGGRPVKASVPGYSKIPWSSKTLSLIGIDRTGKVRYAKTWDEKRDMAFDNWDTILVCWPGTYSQDIFVIDDLEAFRKALGFKRMGESVKVDEAGNEWVA